MLAAGRIKKAILPSPLGEGSGLRDLRVEVAPGEDKDLIQKAREDFRHFKPLYEKYYEPIFRFVYSRVEDKQMAYDLTADVFLKSMLKLGDFKFQEIPFSSWLYRIARNLLADVFRKNRKMRVVSISSVKLQDMCEEIEIDRVDRYGRELAGLIGALKEEELELVEMRFFEKKSFREMAEILDSSEAAVKMKLYRLLEELKKQLIKTH